MNSVNKFVCLFQFENDKGWHVNLQALIFFLPSDSSELKFNFALTHFPIDTRTLFIYEINNFRSQRDKRSSIQFFFVFAADNKIEIC